MKIIKIIVMVVSLTFLIACTQKNNPAEEEVIYEPLEGFTYDENNEKYINEDNGIWYIRENDLNVIPAEEYIEEGVVASSDKLVIENRSNDVWELSEIQEVIVEVGDGFYSLSDMTYNKHYRMDKQWYYEKVKELNELEDIDIIQWRKPFKLPVYVDNQK